MSPQGKKGNPAAASRPAPARDRSASRRRLGLLVFGVLLIALFVVVAAASGIGHPAVPDDAIAVVEEAPDGTVTKEEFDRALVQTAARQGLNEVPPTDDPQYQLLADAAESDLLLARWVLGEAEERGIEVTDREIDAELEKVRTEQFGSEKEFEKFLEDSGFTLDEAKQRLRLQLVSDRIQTAVLPAEPEITDDELQTFYDENIEQFAQPETRDVRVVLTKSEGEADKALAALGTDPSAKTWEEVAKKYSLDEATKATGGLREGVVAGQSEPELDSAIFDAPQGELVGPFESPAGFYVIQVETITPAETAPLDEVREQLTQTLVAQKQQEIAQAFQQNFQSKWVARTICADGYRIDRCSNAEPLPDPCTEDVAQTQGCDAPVRSRPVFAPGSIGVFGSPAPTALPQGPITPQSDVPAGGVPPGLTPVPGGVPPGAAPPGAAPPGTTPQTAPPPGG